MRMIEVVVVGIALLLVPTFANAGVSDDLLHCSKIANSSERVVCYDAVARIATRAQSKAHVPAPTVVANAALVGKSPGAVPDLQAAKPVRSFEGPYALIYGGTSRTVSERKATTSAFIPPEEPFSQIRPKTIGIAVGYNVAVGQIITGIEGRFHRDFGQVDRGNEFVFVSGLPIQYGSGCCSPMVLPPPRTTDRQLAAYGRSREVFEQRYGGDLSWRLGFTPVDWLLVYGRIGGGVKELRYSNENFGASITCQNPITAASFRPPFGTDFFITGCGSMRTVTTRSAAERVAHLPYLLLGTGLELNFDRFFMRIEGELSTQFGSAPFFPVLPQTTSTQVSLAANTGIGFRF